MYVDNNENKDIIKFLESKAASDELIVKIQKYLLRYNEANQNKVYDKLVDIYEYLTYAGLNNQEIDIIMRHYIRILSTSHGDLVKFAAVLSEVPILDRILGVNDSLLCRIHNYKRIYARTLLFALSKTVKPNAYVLLEKPNIVLNNTSAYSIASQEVFGDVIRSDEELYNNLYEKYKINVDANITKLAKEFLLDYRKSIGSKNGQDRSI